MEIKSSFSFRPLPSSLHTSSSFDSTLFPKPVADILFSAAHPMGLEKHERDLNITKERLSTQIKKLFTTTDPEGSWMRVLSFLLIIMAEVY